jgi:hypothetical protein
VLNRDKNEKNLWEEWHKEDVMKDDVSVIEKVVGAKGDGAGEGVAGGLGDEGSDDEED